MTTSARGRYTNNSYKLSISEAPEHPIRKRSYDRKRSGLSDILVKSFKSGQRNPGYSNVSTKPTISTNPAKSELLSTLSSTNMRGHRSSTYGLQFSNQSQRFSRLIPSPSPKNSERHLNSPQSTFNNSDPTESMRPRRNQGIQPTGVNRQRRNQGLQSYDWSEFAEEPQSEIKSPGFNLGSPTDGDSGSMSSALDQQIEEDVYKLIDNDESNKYTPFVVVEQSLEESVFSNSVQDVRRRSGLGSILSNFNPPTLLTDASGNDKGSNVDEEDMEDPDNGSGIDSDTKAEAVANKLNNRRGNEENRYNPPMAVIRSAKETMTTQRTAKTQKTLEEEEREDFENLVNAFLTNNHSQSIYTAKSKPKSSIEEPDIDPDVEARRRITDMYEEIVDEAENEEEKEIDNEDDEDPGGFSIGSFSNNAEQQMRLRGMAGSLESGVSHLRLL